MTDKSVGGTEQRVQGGMIHLGGLLSWPVFEDWGFERGYSEWLHTWSEPQWIAWLLWILKAEPDDSTVFLHGKWATIQRIEELLAIAAKKELKNV